jgi:hypothetical protein
LELTASRERILPVSSSLRSFGSGTVAATHPFAKQIV